MKKTDKQWEDELDSKVFEVTRKKGTEPAFSGKYYKHKEEGNYHCSNCDIELFSSSAKFDSGSGWPSFDDPVAKENIKLVLDNSDGMERTEVVCAECSAHLGHVFNDGPSDTTGKRYCVNSLSLNFKKGDSIKE